MKNSILLFLAFTIIISTFNSCSSQSEEIKEAEKEVKEANKELDRANKAYLKDVEEYRLKTVQKVIENKKAIAELKAEKADAKKEINEDKNEKIAALEKRNNELELKMNNYNYDNESNWSKFKTEFSRDMEELGQSFKDFSKKNVE